MLGQLTNLLEGLEGFSLSISIVAQTLNFGHGGIAAFSPTISTVSDFLELSDGRSSVPTFVMLLAALSFHVD
jgi:hypothetical protein